MIRLLAYHASLLPRLGSTYVFLASLALTAYWAWSRESEPDEIALYLLISGSLLAWFTLLLVIQVGSLHHFHFRPEALQFRLARMRNRHAALGAMWLLLTLLAMAYTLPYLIVLLTLSPNAGLGWVATLNLLLFHVFTVTAGFAVLRMTGGGNVGTVALIGSLFVVPNILAAGSNLIRAHSGVADWVVTVMTYHVRLVGNPDMLLMRHIQNIEAVWGTAVITVILAVITHWRFVCKDHA